MAGCRSARCEGVTANQNAQGKMILVRIVAMLTNLAPRNYKVRAFVGDYEDDDAKDAIDTK